MWRGSDLAKLAEAVVVDWVKRAERQEGGPYFFEHAG
jgi:hypothetical protein